MALQNTNLNGSGGLLERLDIITDPRKSVELDIARRLSWLSRYVQHYVMLVVMKR